jgi:hypothetical protein
MSQEITKTDLFLTILFYRFQGHLIAINYGTRMSKLTKPGETDVIFFGIDSGKIERRIELAEVITDREKSKCRFLACDGKRIFVVDLGKFIVKTSNSGILKGFSLFFKATI